ncbi:MAG: hypothetical protein ABR524_07750 [Thermoanaerobaculia bacterium]
MNRTINRFINLIALVLVLAAVAFAWSRSSLIEPSDHATAAVPEWYLLGQRTYATECSGCHPRGDLAEALSAAASPDGRLGVINLMVHGTATHPDYAHLNDQTLAATLNYALREGSGQTVTPFEPGEFAAERREQ